MRNSDFQETDGSSCPGIWEASSILAKQTVIGPAIVQPFVHETPVVIQQQRREIVRWRRVQWLRHHK